MKNANDLEFTPSTFGGGWIEPLTSAGRIWAEGYFETDAYELPAINGEGWMIEPYEVADVQAALIAARVRVGQ